MNKADIVERISQSNGCTRAESAELVDTVFLIMKNTLAEGGTLKVHGFGVFSVKKKKERKGRNPLTGEDLTISARKILTFRPSLLLKQAVNKE